jgi:hypothetical protein
MVSEWNITLHEQQWIVIWFPLPHVVRDWLGLLM